MPCICLAEPGIPQLNGGGFATQIDPVSWIYLLTCHVIRQEAQVVALGSVLASERVNFPGHDGCVLAHSLPQVIHTTTSFPSFNP